ELRAAIELIQDCYNVLGFTGFSYRLSLRDPNDTEKYFQDDEMWNSAEAQLREGLGKMGLEFYESPGDAAFYGPKVDIQVRSALGKDETLSTVQLDFLLPQKFELEYVAEDGSRQRPVMIHRGLLSTMERMTAFLIEQTAGNFPLWLAPRQVAIIPIADRHNDYAWELRNELHAAGLRVEVDDSSNRMQAKVREAELSRIPFMLIVGDKEQEAREVSLRERTPEGTQERKGVKFDELKAELIKRRDTRA
ncbi:threonine--tRNA ligase, partial [Deinococcus sp.]|uniref:threonine--tRNA ligase n=1 Tax=Deinococcus sp. TaxID=47478 RepID=UPI0025BA8F6B